MIFLSLLLALVSFTPADAMAPAPTREEMQFIAPSSPTPLLPITKPIPEPDVTHREEACNCYNLLKKHFSDVPFMQEIQSRAGVAFGNVAVFMYPPTEDFPDGMPHVAMTTGYMEAGTFEIEEYNYHECKQSRRMISFTDPYLMGFTTLTD